MALYEAWEKDFTAKCDEKRTALQAEKKIPFLGKADVANIVKEADAGLAFKANEVEDPTDEYFQRAKQHDAKVYAQTVMDIPPEVIKVDKLLTDPTPELLEQVR